MADTDKESKTEKASAKRLSDAFQKGTFAQAQEIGVVFTLFAGLIVVIWFGRDLSMNVMNLSVSILGNLSAAGGTVPDQLLEHFSWSGQQIGQPGHGR